MMNTTETTCRIQPNRKITGMSAILLPFFSDGKIDWKSFGTHVERTCDAGLIPAINMDTGYGPFLESAESKRALEVVQNLSVGSFVAGAFVKDSPSDRFDFDAYAKQIAEIQTFGGTPIIFQSFGLAHASDAEIVGNYQAIAECCDAFLAFELGTMFADFGAIYSLEVYRELVQMRQCVGAKHSSLSRELEWQRLDIRDELRPEFKVLTGNDLAIDMVMYGSDYLLGLSTFCPEIFAKRDRMWEAGDVGFYELNDALQSLGAFAFRNPTSAYKHNAAMFLYQSGWVESDLTHPHCQRRPESDRAILHEIGRTLGLDMNLDGG